MRQTIVNSTVGAGCILTQHLHNINLSAVWPFSVDVLIRQEPEGRQKSLPCRHLQSGFENAVGKLMLPPCVDPPGGVGIALVLPFSFHRPK